METNSEDTKPIDNQKLYYTPPDKENLWEADKIRTFTGIYINPFDATPEQINIQDIAHALANIPRFGGHPKRFLSVAEHCLYCYAWAPDAFKLEALLHDASEAYLLDIPRPIKNRLPGYKEAEERLMGVIAQALSLVYPMPAIIKDIDNQALVFEWENLVLKDIRAADRLRPYTNHEETEKRFLQAFRQAQTLKSITQYGYKS